MEKEMATHSSILAWKTPWMEKLGGLQSMELQRVRHDFTFTFTVIENVITEESWMKEPWDSRYYFCDFLLVYNYFKIKFF